MKNKRYNCPFCPGLGLRNDDLALSVSWEKGKYHCFRCGTSGGVRSLPPNFKQPLILERDKKPRERLSMEDMIPLRQSSAGQSYLEVRGLDPDPLKDFVFVSGKKLVFPFYEPEGNITFYVSRKMWGSGRRYDNMEAAVRDIYIPPGIILPAQRILIVTEGIFDALSVWQCLGIESIALLGMNINSFKVRRILDCTYPNTLIIILLDAGELKTAVSYLDELTPLRRYTKICQLDEGDPNEIGEKRLRQILYPYLVPLYMKGDEQWKKLMRSASSVEERTSLSTS